MSKDINLKKIDTVVGNNYISKIGDIAGNIKNITIEATLKNLKKFELKDSIVVILDLEDNTGKINALLVVERDEKSFDIIKNIIKNNRYCIRGIISSISEDMLSEFDILIDNNKSIRDYITSNQILIVRKIEKISNDLKIIKIRLSYSFDNKKTSDLDISFNCIKHFEINGITSTISHSTNGELLDFIDCEKLKLVIYKNKLKNKDVNIILNSDIYFYSVGVFLDNGENNFYNLPYYSNDSSRNYLQFIYDKGNVIKIIVDNSFKYKKIK